MDSGVNIISFDLDGTLITDDGDKHLWNELIPKEYAHDRDIPLQQAKKEVYAAYYHAEHIEHADEAKQIHYWVNRLELRHRGDFNESLADATTRYDDVNALEALAEHHTVTLFTNSSRGLMEAKLQKLPRNVFDKTISAPTDYNSNKRNHNAWLTYLDDLDTRGAHLMHIGDRVIDDVQVPSRLGIKGRLLNRDNEQTGDYTSLHDIKDNISQY